jgi:hypothetical protein
VFLGDAEECSLKASQIARQYVLVWSRSRISLESVQKFNKKIKPRQEGSVRIYIVAATAKAKEVIIHRPRISSLCDSHWVDDEFKVRFSYYVRTTLEHSKRPTVACSFEE